jgi:putative effector of murein hydrolase
MQSENIANCFQKAQILSSDTTPLEHSIIQDSLTENIAASIAQDIQAFESIHAAMDIQNFINSPEK